ncbi:hypothetical protein NDU88_000246 [Pleurodeles waltl]|uniref:Uncharacterized protein n=1 Tax=Pleurodeles waltl TaxID=8319 RepID=A0AAV7VU38_PLEWA|nr:hypothetical protein NDU88_000246 [Pleurodeles waltl]
MQAQRCTGGRRLGSSRCTGVLLAYRDYSGCRVHCRDTCSLCRTKSTFEYPCHGLADRPTGRRQHQMPHLTVQALTS